MPVAHSYKTRTQRASDSSPCRRVKIPRFSLISSNSFPYFSVAAKPLRPQYNIWTNVLFRLEDTTQRQNI